MFFANPPHPNFGFMPFRVSSWIQMEDNDSEFESRGRPRIPGSFEHDYDSSDEEERERNHGLTQSYFFEGPGFMFQRTSVGVPPRNPGGESGQPAPSGPNIVDMLQTILSSIMGEQTMERARQEAQREAQREAGSGAAGEYGSEDRPRPPPLPGMGGVFSSSPPGSRFAQERPPRPGNGVDDLPSCVPYNLYYFVPFICTYTNVNPID